jgi:hypothetical protein
MGGRPPWCWICEALKIYAAVCGVCALRTILGYLPFILTFFVMLSEAKHLVLRDSSVAFGSLRMTREMTSQHLLVLK